MVATLQRLLLTALGLLLGTQLGAAGDFYPATEDHQNYYRENPLRYRFYRLTCGRDNRLEELWSSE
jgi:peptide-methionine (S)-S-oxide reductase